MNKRLFAYVASAFLALAGWSHAASANAIVAKADTVSKSGHGSVTNVEWRGRHGGGHHWRHHGGGHRWHGDGHRWRHHGLRHRRHHYSYSYGWPYYGGYYYRPYYYRPYYRSCRVVRHRCANRYGWHTRRWYRCVRRHGC